MKINSHDEWGRLREVIVGTVDDMAVGLEFSSAKPVTKALFEKAVKISRKATPKWYRDEINEDIQGLCKIITKFGAKVLRPASYGAEKLYSTPHWSSTGKDLYNMRDLHIVVGNKVIASASPAKCRYFEQDSLYDIWYRYLSEGFQWIAAPKPKLIGKYLFPYYRHGKEIMTEEDVIHRKLSGGRGEKFYRLTEDEILFDAANIIRMGKDLIYLISSTGNHKGAQWLQSILGEEYRVHTTTTYRSSHIDSTILPLRPGLILLNAARVNPENCPKILNQWKRIYFNDMAPLPQEEIDFQKNVRDKVYKELLALDIETDLNHMSSPWAGLNVLSLDSRTVLVHDRQIKLIKELERHRLTVIPVCLRHCYTLLGGLHCATLDTVRDGKLEKYFN